MPRLLARAVRRAIAPVAAILGLSTAVHAATNLTVYTALEADVLPVYQRSFEAAHPDIRISWVRDSTGVITARLLAERDNPRADAVLALAATSMLVLKSEGLFEPYKPKGIEQIDPRFVDEDDPPYWVGTNAWASALCINTIVMQQRGLPTPESWADLIKPEYANTAVMSNPASSGTGFLAVSAWLQMMGEDKGWEYMEQLNRSMSSYVHSGSRPCTMAGAGETPIGLSFEFRAARMINEGAPIVAVIPQEGIGWDMEASAIIKDTPNVDAAERLLDWAVSDEAMKIYANYYAILANAKFEQPMKGFPSDIRDRLIKNDFEWAAANRARILEEWQRRFESKSAPRG
jgi:iron(III) transport system substrate-binding protein